VCVVSDFIRFVLCMDDSAKRKIIEMIIQTLFIHRFPRSRNGRSERGFESELMRDFQTTVD